MPEVAELPEENVTADGDPIDPAVEGERWRREMGGPKVQYEVHTEPMTLNGTFHYVVEAGKDPKAFENIVALCPRREDAERIRAALGMG